MNQSGRRYHSYNLSPAHGVLHEGQQLVTNPLRGWTPKTTQARVSMVCSTRADSWPPYDRAQIPLGESQTCDSVCSMRAKSRTTAQLKFGSKIEGTPYEGCWQNQSGYWYHSATFSP